MTDSELIAQLKQARGSEYARLFRQADATIGERLRQQVKDTKKQNGKCSLRDIVKMAVVNELPLKTTFRMLEGAVIPTGTYDYIVSGGFKVNEAFEIARKEIANGTEK